MHGSFHRPWFGTTHLLLGVTTLLLFVTSRADEHGVAVGVARIDVTPDFPIRMGGYAVRKTRSTGVEQPLWAKALAIKVDAQQPVVFVTLDNNGIAEETYRRIA